MEFQPSGSSQLFPAHLDRRLSRLFLAFALAFLVAGGISATLAIRIYHVNRALTEEYGHVLELERIDTAFDRVIAELLPLQEYQSVGINRVERLSEELIHRLDTFRDLHRNEPVSSDRAVELALIDNLREFAADLHQIGERALAILRPLRGSDRSVIDRLTLLSHQVSDKVEDLNRIHQARISKLTASNQRTMRAIAFVYLWFLLVGGALIVVASVSFKWNIATPLRKLAHAAERIAEGRLDERVPVPSKDEIGLLSHAFNVMTDRLQEHERQLQTAHSQLEHKVKATRALYQIGIEISGLHQLDQILQTVVEKSRELVTAEAAALGLLGPEKELLLHASSGPPDAFRRDAPSVPASPDPEAAWEAGQPACPFIQDPSLQSRLAAPVRHRDRLVGILWVFRRDAQGFRPEDTELLHALATQAAIAIEHVRLHEELQSLATIEERTRLAREIHDSLAQSLSLLYTKLRRAEERVLASPDRIPEALRDMASITESAFDDLRQSMFDLRAMTSHRRDLAHTLAQYVREFSLQTGIVVDFEVADKMPHQPSSACEVQLVRIVQEALANVRKHSGTSEARVRLESWDEGVKVTIEDHGRGCDPALLISPNTRHFGLQTMRERAESLGGSLELDSSPGQGMRVVATLPAGAYDARFPNHSRAPG